MCYDIIKKITYVYIFFFGGGGRYWKSPVAVRHIIAFTETPIMFVGCCKNRLPILLSGTFFIFLFFYPINYVMKDCKNKYTNRQKPPSKSTRCNNLLYCFRGRR